MREAGDLAEVDPANYSVSGFQDEIDELELLAYEISKEYELSEGGSALIINELGVLMRREDKISEDEIKKVN
eukprot:CAMPEP_0170555184 /NCGR_PEP_ID=MMETSP0211-20121228/13074_1 /TAXON_ID=311385 /ORGANISM="Pseudokeronopsis sp., Strain OXSARD2" /LENGTH=71 /DNA_ID=CAMNT_0010864839 /DNA_START=612 /DNA_END=827 /DNA_ORIENTATION=-